MPQPLRDFAEFEDYLGRFTNYERMQFPRYDKTTFGLERMRSFARDLGDPQESYPSVHVAGTKGKGSTCLLLEALLLEEGYSVGTYLSPHVEHLTERIRVDGDPVSCDEIVRTLNGMLGLLERLRDQGVEGPPSFFEIMTAVAMVIFRCRRVDWAVFEVGLGGRLDATNILCPRVCAITSIGLEHTRQLGSTLGQIAREKAGIVKPGIPLYLGPVHPEAEEEICRIASERGAAVLYVANDAVLPAGDSGIHLKALDASFDRGPVLGPALRTDLAIALALLNHILGAEGKSPDPARVGRAISRAVLPARIEVIPGSPPVVVDAAHTVEAVRALRLSLEEIRFPRPRILIFSVVAGKRIAAILEELEDMADDRIWTRADLARSVDPAELRALAGSGEPMEPPEKALECALSRRRPIVVTGSFYLAGRLRALVQARRQAKP